MAVAGDLALQTRLLLSLRERWRKRANGDGSSVSHLLITWRGRCHEGNQVSEMICRAMQIRHESSDLRGRGSHCRSISRPQGTQENPEGKVDVSGLAVSN